jgi:DNA-binding NtrC family response regulator
MAETLKGYGHVVSEASSADTALAVASQSTPGFDVVLLDFRLPDSKDLTLLAKLRRLLPRAQIIMMTAYGTSEVFQQALELGAYRIISKPFELEEVADLVLQAHSARPV